MEPIVTTAPPRRKPKGIQPYLPGLRIEGNLSDVSKGSSLARRVLRLLNECDRIDALPEGDVRDEAVDHLLARVARFQRESPSDQEEALTEAMAMIG
jgi:hypothetical protein